MYTTEELQEKINRYIAEIPFVREPVELYKPIEYVMHMGGKRVRPVLMLMAYHLYNEDVSLALAPASGIEIFHNYTLLHDDLMDRADIRRGKRTVHKVWDDNTAILSGDAMFVLACQYIAQTPSSCLKEVLDVFNRTALEVCEGQQYDVDFEDRNDVTADEYINMIRLKTAVLLAASLKIGALLGNASAKDVELLYKFGINIGLAFQLKDDYLDVYGNPLIFGKNLGGDILCNKKTYMLIKAFELANEKQIKNLNFWINKHNFDSEEKIKVVTDLYNEIGVKRVCEKKMTEYYSDAIKVLKEVSVNECRKNELKKLVQELMYREQ